MPRSSRNRVSFPLYFQEHNNAPLNGFTEIKTEPIYVYISPFVHRFCRFSLIASLVIVVNRVISDTPTCFFLKPSFQSACERDVNLSNA